MWFEIIYTIVFVIWGYIYSIFLAVWPVLSHKALGRSDFISTSFRHNSKYMWLNIIVAECTEVTPFFFFFLVTSLYPLCLLWAHGHVVCIRKLVVISLLLTTNSLGRVNYRKTVLNISAPAYFPWQEISLLCFSNGLGLYL